MANEAENLDIEITDEKIEKAAVPEKRRVEEEVSDEAVEVSLGDDSQEVSPVTEDEVKEDFAVSPKVEEQAKDLSEVEKRASLAQNRINKAVAQAKEFQRRELMAVQYAKDLKDQNEKLRQQQKSFSHSYSDEFTNRVESQMTLAKQALRQATEAQDAEAIAAATEALTLATTDKARLQQYSQAQKQYEEQEAAYQLINKINNNIKLQSNMLNQLKSIMSHHLKLESGRKRILGLDKTRLQRQLPLQFISN